MLHGLSDMLILSHVLVIYLSTLTSISTHSSDVSLLDSRICNKIMSLHVSEDRASHASGGFMGEDEISGPAIDSDIHINNYFLSRLDSGCCSSIWVQQRRSCAVRIGGLRHRTFIGPISS